MFKDLLLSRSGTPAELRKHMEDVHIPMGLSIPAVAREMQRYTLNHVEGSPVAIAIHPPIDRLSTIVEHVCGGWEGLTRLGQDPDFQEKLLPDEQYMSTHLMDGQAEFVAIDEEQPIFTSGDVGTLRVFDLLRRSASVSREQFLRQLEAEGAWAKTDDRYRAAVGQRVHSIVGEGTASYGEAAEPFDAVVETWPADLHRLEDLVDELRSRRSAYCDPAGSFTVVTEERWFYGEVGPFGPRAESAGRS